ncbi:hypothetical protein A3219_21000 [Salmonella enterica]|nr:hypothetical protein A3219_21000 [Salmonella enterica]
MGWLAVDNQLIERVLAGFHTGRSLNGVNTANQIERVDDKQMSSHGVLPYKPARPANADDASRYCARRHQIPLRHGLAGCG